MADKEPVIKHIKYTGKNYREVKKLIVNTIDKDILNWVQKEKGIVKVSLGMDTPVFYMIPKAHYVLVTTQLGVAKPMQVINEKLFLKMYDEVVKKHKEGEVE